MTRWMYIISALLTGCSFYSCPLVYLDRDVYMFKNYLRFFIIIRAWARSRLHSSTSHHVILG